MGISFERVSVMNAFANWDDINIKSPEKTKIRFSSLCILLITSKNQLMLKKINLVMSSSI